MGVNINGAVLPIEELHLSYLVHILRTEYGFLESSRTNVSRTKDGVVIPMYTYPCLEYLDSFDWDGAKVFEYGSGYSTIWWSGHKKANVTAVELDKEWYERIKINTKGVNLTLETDKDKYTTSCDGEYDVIIVDGNWRAECAAHAIKNIKKDGMILLDNTDMYEAAKQVLDESGLIPIHFHGFKPIHVESETTSCYIGREFSRIPNSIVPVGGTDRRSVLE